MHWMHHLSLDSKHSRTLNQRNGSWTIYPTTILQIGESPFSQCVFIEQCSTTKIYSFLILQSINSLLIVQRFEMAGQTGARSIRCSIRGHSIRLLTSFLVEQNLELIDHVIVQCAFQFFHCCFVRFIADHEGAFRWSLHNVRSIVAGHLAEALRTVHDWVVDDLSVGQQKACVRYVQKKEKEERVTRLFAGSKLVANKWLVDDFVISWKFTQIRLKRFLKITFN